MSTPTPFSVATQASSGLSMGQQLAALHQISVVLSRSLELEQTLTSMLQSLYEHAQMAHGLVCLFDHNRSALFIQAMQGVDPEVVKERGFSLLDIKRYVESLGMRGRGYRVDENRLRSLRVPSLVLMDVNGFRHFVVLKQVRGDLVEIGDPILGNRVMPLPDFLEAWPSRAVFVVIGTDFDRNTVLLQPSTKPSARALYARQGPLTDAELLDFGFTHADLF